MVQVFFAGLGMLKLRLVIVATWRRKFLRVSSGMDRGIRVYGVLVDHRAWRLASRVRP